MVRLAATLLFLFSSVVNFEIHANSTTETLREAYKVVREARREWKKQQRIEEEQQQEENLVVCIQCPRINGLVGDINKAMEKMVQQGDIEISERGALEEIERLEAMYYIVENDLDTRAKMGDDTIQEPCSFYQLDIYLKTIGNEPLRPSELTEIFTFNIDPQQIQNINSIHYRRPDEKGRYYIYRAAPPNNDKIIRVHLPREGQPTVTYFQMGEMPSPEESDFIKKRLRRQAQKDIENSLGKDASGEDVSEVEKIYGMEYWGSLGQYQSESSKWTYGVAMAHKDNLPRRILLLKGEDETQLFEGFKVRTDVEVSDRDQEVNFSLADTDREYLKLKAEADGDYRAAIPFNIGISEYRFGAKGDIAQTNEGQEASLSLTHDNSTLINVRAKKNNDGTQIYNVGNRYDDVLGGSVSLEYERANKVMPDGNKERFWVKYSVSF